MHRQDHQAPESLVQRRQYLGQRLSAPDQGQRAAGLQHPARRMHPGGERASGGLVRESARGIGRGAMANPWIFRQIEDTLAGRNAFQPSLDDKRAVLLEYFDMLRDDMPVIPAIGRMKQLAGQFTRGLQGGATFRQSIYHSHSIEEILDRIAEYFETVAAGIPYGQSAEAEDEMAPELDSCEVLSTVP